MKKSKNEIFDGLFVLELANNHLGNLERGLSQIEEFSQVVRFNNVKAAIKLQFRDMDTFVHPEYVGSKDVKYIKKTTEKIPAYVRSATVAVRLDRVALSTAKARNANAVGPPLNTVCISFLISVFTANAVVFSARLAAKFICFASPDNCFCTESRPSILIFNCMVLVFLGCYGLFR